jgi:predicted deacylase
MASIETFDLDAAYTGTSRRLRVFRYGARGARPKAYLQGALHAGEMTGVVAIHHLRLLLEAEALIAEAMRVD